MQHNYYTRRQLSILGIGDLQEIAREVGAELPPEGSMRRFWIDAILAVAERKATDSSREVKLDNYRPTALNHPPLYKIYGGRDHA